MGLYGVQPPHPPPPPSPNFKDCFKCKGKEVEKREKYMKVKDGGGGVPTNIFRGLRVLRRS